MVTKEELEKELKALKEKNKELEGKLKRKVDTLSTPINTEKKKIKVNEFESMEAMIEKLYREGKIEEAANFGHPKAILELANRYCDGRDGVKKDWHKAMKWGEKAAEKNDPLGCYLVGHMMYCGENGIRRDYNKALQYFLRSLESGQLPSCLSVYQKIGEIYALGSDGVKVDPEEAMKWYRKIIDEQRYGYMTDAYTVLARAYHHGVGKKKNLKKARKYYEIAINSEHVWLSDGPRANAYCHYAEMLMKGEGGEKNPWKAFTWLQESAELGGVHAITILEKMENLWDGLKNYTSPS
eukprot:g774.t1